MRRQRGSLDARSDGVPVSSRSVLSVCSVHIIACPPWTRCSFSAVMFAYGSKLYINCHETKPQYDGPVNWVEVRQIMLLSSTMRGTYVADPAAVATVEVEVIGWSLMNQPLGQYDGGLTWMML